MRGAYDRLNPLDRWFLLYEKPFSHMHVAGNSIFEAGPLRRPDGGLDIARIKAFIESRLAHIPRYRQVLARTPFGAPVWVDDPHFDLDYHVRHTCLPPPGSDAQHKAVCGRIFSEPLDRSKPLWEIWVIEGAGGGQQFGFISKIHHAMVDGVAAVDLLEALLTHEPQAAFEPAQPWAPRPAPSAVRLAFDDVKAVLGDALHLVRRAPALVADAFKRGSEVRAAVRGLADLTLKTIRRPTETPLNQRIGPHRRFDWLTLDAGELKAVRGAFGGSSNDVVLAIVAGAVRRFFQHRGVDPRGIEFRVMAPVSVRPREARGETGNRVAAWMVPLPIAEPDPRRRLALVQEATRRLKEEKNALGTELLTEMVGWTPKTVLSLSARIPWRDLPFNMVVTNVPGPQRPLYLLGSKMVADHSLVPLADYTALGLVIFTYDGRVDWGFNADRDLVPDLDMFVRCVDEAFSELRDLARPVPPPPRQVPVEAARV